MLLKSGILLECIILYVGLCYIYISNAKNKRKLPISIYARMSFVTSFVTEIKLNF